ncbi:MAG: type II toxin-antitoxin system death-on-curing family toxin [Enterocloster asparagiformis]|nr:type II toxin-antitoxin system death-on-curing family toxin [Enterocloster asparagiformis]
MIRLNKKQILILHSQLIEKFGGMEGIRDESLLDSALAAPFQSFGAEELFPSIQAKAARLCFGLVKNHAMMDGNKRLGAHTMLVFLELNGCHLKYSQDELIEIILGVACGENVADDLLHWIIDHQI